MLLAGLCPGPGTCPRPAGGGGGGGSSSGQNVATLTQRQSLSSHPELCPGSWGQVPPDTNWSGGKRLPSQTGIGPPRVPPCAQGPGWCRLALPPRVTPGPKFSWPCQSGTWCRTQGTRLSPSQPSPRGPQASREGDSPPLHIWPRPPGSAVENSRPRCSPSPSSCSVPAARLGDCPSARLGPARPTSSLPRPAPAPGRRLGGQAAGEPLRLPSVFIPSPQTLWVAVPFPVEQETRLFPRLGAIPLPLWLCPGTKTQQGNAPGARKRRDSAIHPPATGPGG